MKSLLRPLGQKGKVKLPTKQIRLLSNVSELLIEPLPNLRARHMKGILPPLPQTKRPIWLLNNHRFLS